MNRVTTEKDKYAVVISNLLFKVVRRIPRTVASEERPCTILKDLVVVKLQEIPVTARWFTKVNLGIVWPLPHSQGFRYT